MNSKHKNTNDLKSRNEGANIVMEIWRREALVALAGGRKGGCALVEQRFGRGGIAPTCGELHLPISY